MAGTAVSRSTGPRPPSRVSRQEMAPAGGYSPVDIRRNVPKSVTRAGAIALFVGGGLTMAYGFYKVGNFNIHRRYGFKFSHSSGVRYRERSSKPVRSRLRASIAL
jgi:hypothetical protein